MGWRCGELVVAYQILTHHPVSRPDTLPIGAAFTGAAWQNSRYTHAKCRGLSPVGFPLRPHLCRGRVPSEVPVCKSICSGKGPNIKNNECVAIGPQNAPRLYSILTSCSRHGANASPSFHPASTRPPQCKLRCGTGRGHGEKDRGREALLP